MKLGKEEHQNLSLSFDMIPCNYTGIKIQSAHNTNKQDRDSSPTFPAHKPKTWKKKLVHHSQKIK